MKKTLTEALGVNAKFNKTHGQNTSTKKEVVVNNPSNGKVNDKASGQSAANSKTPANQPTKQPNKLDEKGKNPAVEDKAKAEKKMVSSTSRSNFAEAASKLSNRFKKSSSLGDFSKTILEISSKGTDFFELFAGDTMSYIEAQVNTSAKIASELHDLGATKDVRTMVAPIVNDIISLLGKLPNYQKLQRYFSEQDYSEFHSLKMSLSTAQNKGTLSDVFKVMLNLRSTFIRLMTTTPMLEAEAGFTDEIAFITLSKFAKVDTIGANRNTPMDNAIESDITLVKPVFLLMVDNELKWALKDRKVSQQVINYLGNYTVPSQRWDKETSTATTHAANLTEAPSSFKSPHKFAWSENGHMFASKTIKSYRRVNQQFLKEVDDLYSAAINQKVFEITMDVAVLSVLSSWLNSATKVLMEANLDAISEINKGSNFDRDRLIGTDSNALAMQFLSYAKSSSNGESLIEAIISHLNSKLSLNLGYKPTYSEFAYNYLRREFKTLTFGVDSTDTKYYMGPNLVGNHKYKIIVTPMLYIPIDLAVLVNKPTNSAEAKAKWQFTYVPLSTDAISVNPISDHLLFDSPLNFILDIKRAFYQVDRDTVYDSSFVVFTILPFLMSIQQSDYNTLVAESLSDKWFRTPFGATVTLKDFLDYRTVPASPIGHPRTLSGIPPFYYKSILLEQIPTHVKPGNDDIWRYPVSDMLWNHAGEKNDGNILEDGYPFKFGDEVRALINFHADFSWVEMALVYAHLMDNKWFKLSRPTIKVPGESTFSDMSAANKAAHRLAASISLDMSKYSAVVAPTDEAQAYFKTINAILREFNQSLKYTVKVKVVKLLQLDSFDPKSILSAKPTLISKDDVALAFRYQPVLLGVDGNGSDITVFIDNFDPKPNSKWLMSHDGNNITGIHKAFAKGEAVRVNEADIKRDITPTEFWDLTPVVWAAEGYRKPFHRYSVVGTEFIGYYSSAWDGFKTPRDLIRSNINKDLYVFDNFVPTWMTMHVVLPTNEPRSALVIGNDSYTACYNNGKMAILVAKILYTMDAISGNTSDALKLISASFGLTTNDSTVLTYKYFLDGTTDVIGELKFTGISYHASATEYNGELPKVTTKRYPSSVILPATVAITGLHVAPDFNSESEKFISMRKSIAYCKSLNCLPSNPYTNNLASFPFSMPEKDYADVELNSDALPSSTGTFDYKIIVQPVEVYRVNDMLDTNHVSPDSPI